MDYPAKVFITLFVGLHTQSQEKIVKKPQILGSVTIFSYICSRIHKQIGGTLSGIIKM